MKQKALSLVLALTMCLSLSIPAFAAGTKKEVVDETHGVKITMNEFLRVETNRYAFMGGAYDVKIYVVADNSTATAEALEGRKYADADFVEATKSIRYGSVVSGMPGYEEYMAFESNKDSYAYKSTDERYWNPETLFFDDTYVSWAWPLEGVTTYTVSPHNGDVIADLGGIFLDKGYEISWMCESDYARLVPATLHASDWARAEVEKAYDAGLMSYELNPYRIDCAEGMTRAGFAATTVRLYAAMIGKDYDELDISSESPFTDVDYDDAIGMAYNLGFVNGKGGTTFDPEGTLTRQEAAVMMARVYAKVHGDIPKVANTAFADDGDIASWAKSEVAFMSGREIVNGVGENRFAPAKTLSVQEAVIMAYRMLEKLK